MTTGVAVVMAVWSYNTLRAASYMYTGSGKSLTRACFNDLKAGSGARRCMEDADTIVKLTELRRTRDDVGYT